MSSALLSLLPERVYRNALIDAVQKNENYKTKAKAETFVARQVHRLTKLNWLNASGARNSRWYEPSEELLNCLSLARTAKSVISQELRSEEKKLESEVSLLLAEMEEFKVLSDRYPLLLREIEGLILEQRSQITCLYGKLSAVRKLKMKAEQMEMGEC